MNSIILTENFSKDLESLIGKVSFAPNGKAQLIYKMLVEHPEAFEFAISYVTYMDGRKELTEVSIIPKRKQNT